MGRISSTSSKELRKKIEESTVQRNRLALIASTLAGHTVLHYANPLFNKTPMHTSILTGEGRMKELFDGHPSTFYNEFGMSKHVFMRLVQELHQFTSFNDSKYITMIEQLGIFLWICRRGASVRDTMYHFQRSPDTIHRCIYLHKI